jgi:hypothetical protein
LVQQKHQAAFQSQSYFKAKTKGWFVNSKKFQKLRETQKWFC